MPNPKHAEAEVPRERGIGELAAALVRRPVTLLGVTALVVGLAGAFVILAPRTYEASALVQVEPRSRPVSAFGDASTLFQVATPTEGEMRVMKSRPLLEGVVDQLGLEVEARPRTLPLVGGALARRHAGDGPATAPAGLERFAFGGERLRVGRLAVPDALLDVELVLTALEGGRYELRSGASVLLEGEAGTAAARSPGGELELEVKELVARPGTEFLLTKRPRAEVVERLQEALRISEQGLQTGVVELRLAGRDPARVAAIVALVADTWVVENAARTSAVAEATLASLEAQLPGLEARASTAERGIAAFALRHGTVNLSFESQGWIQRVVELDRAAAENELRQAELTQRYGDRHPDLAAIRETSARLAGQRATAEARLKTLPGLELESARLAREARVATELLVLVKNRAEELRLVTSRWIGNVRVLEPAAVPFRPTSPKPGLVLALGALLGLVAGASAAIARDGARRGVVGPEELEEATGLDVLASIPRSRAQRRLSRRGRREAQPPLAMARPDDLAVEDLRDLRTGVQFLLRSARNQVVAVTGLAPNAGKSFVSANLAHLLAAAGGRVLLVDADLRRGALHRPFGVEESPGLSDVLLGGSPLDAAIRPTSTPGLELLAAGGHAGNPAELLAGARLGELLQDLGRRYALVVVDTPPVLSVADAALVARHAGVNLLVVRAGVHTADELRFALKRLARAGVAVRGAILNDLHPSLAYGKARYKRYELAKPRREAPPEAAVH